MCYSAAIPSSINSILPPEGMHWGVLDYYHQVNPNEPWPPMILVELACDARDDESVQTTLEQKGKHFLTEEQVRSQNGRPPPPFLTSLAQINEAKMKLGAVYFHRCSAKTDEGVKELFETIIPQVHLENLRRKAQSLSGSSSRRRFCIIL